MTLIGVITLFSVMAGLAAMPSSSVLLVVTRSATLNIRNGLATSAGVVAGDLIFMTFAILGMTVLAEQLGAFFVVIKFAAAAYLIWFGVTLLRSPRQEAEALDYQSRPKNGGLIASFTAGLLLTMGDIKAIIFYASLLPAFVDLTSLTTLDIAIVSAITIIAVGGVKALYAIFAGKLAHRSRGFKYSHELKLTVGSLMVGAGLFLAVKN